MASLSNYISFSLTVIVHNYYKVNLNLIVLHKCPGLSLDHQSTSGASRVRLSEREEECLTCYLMACDAGLLYLQELDKVCVCEVCGFTQNVFISHFVSHCILSISVCVIQIKKDIQQVLTFSLLGLGCLAFLNVLCVCRFRTLEYKTFYI